MQNCIKYLTKHHCGKDRNPLFTKQCIKGGETKILTYQLSWFQKKTENAYNKELQSGLCKVLVLFDKIRDQNLEVNLLKLYLKMLLSWKKIPSMKPKSINKKRCDKKSK